MAESKHTLTGRQPASTGKRPQVVVFTRQAEQIDGPTLVLSDVEHLCAVARFCDPGGKIWGLMERTDNPKARKLVIREAMHRPAGRLVLHTGKEIGGPLEPGIGVVEDPALGYSGPLWVQGGNPSRIRERQTL